MFKRIANFPRNVLVVFATGIVLFGALLAFLYWFHISLVPQVTNGMKAAEIERLYGPPDKMIPAGEEISRFGSHKSYLAPSETWIYHILPKSTRRMVITLEDGVVVHSELQFN